MTAALSVVVTLLVLMPAHGWLWVLRLGVRPVADVPPSGLGLMSVAYAYDQVLDAVRSSRSGPAR